MIHGKQPGLIPSRLKRQYRETVLFIFLVSEMKSTEGKRPAQDHTAKEQQNQKQNKVQA